MHDMAGVPWQLPGLWVNTNLLTGLSYVAISFVIRKWAGFVRAEYVPLFSFFIGACGLHHLVMAVFPFMLGPSKLYLLASIVDTLMMGVSIVTACLVVQDAWRTRHLPPR